MSVTFDFSGKVALVTGSSSGIGEGIAILLSKSGAKVVITGRNGDKLKAVAKKCLDVSPTKSKPLEVVADVTKEEELEKLVKATIDKFGRLDILVNNAGAGFPGAFTDADYYEKFKKQMQTNLNSMVFLTHRCIQYLEKSKGNIINISSVGGIRSISPFSSYCTSKAAMDMFTHCLASELGSKHIRVNVINPGAVRTGFIEALGIPKAVADSSYDKYGKTYPLGRSGIPEDIAYAVCFIASGNASFITGSNLIVDGGANAANTLNATVE